MKLSAKEVEEKLEEETDGDIWIDLYYSDVEEVYESELGHVLSQDSGSTYDDGQQARWIVFKIGNQYFRKTGFYDSWAGGEWDGELEEVTPRETTITVYDSLEEK